MENGWIGDDGSCQWVKCAQSCWNWKNPQSQCVRRPCCADRHADEAASSALELGCWLRFPLLWPHHQERANLEMFCVVSGLWEWSEAALIPVECSSLGRTPEWRGRAVCVWGGGWGRKDLCPAALMTVLMSSHLASLPTVTLHNTDLMCGFLVVTSRIVFRGDFVETGLTSLFNHFLVFFPFGFSVCFWS